MSPVNAQELRNIVNVLIVLRKPADSLFTSQLTKLDVTHLQIIAESCYQFVGLCCKRFQLRGVIL